MHILDSNINMSSQFSSVQKREQYESLTYWKGESERVTLQQNNSTSGMRNLITRAENQLALEDLRDKVRFSEESQRMFSASQAMVADAQLSIEKAETEEMDRIMEEMQNFEMRLVKMLVESLTGKEIEVAEMGRFEVEVNLPQAPSSSDTQPSESTEDDFGLIYKYHESYEENESVQYHAQGLVKTADGQEIHIDLSMNLSRRYYTETDVEIREGQALKDPLVINFDGNAAQLTKTKYDFDIDVDGQMDQISFVKQGSGFIALDKNGDGVINDGSELFGATSGNGFADLKAYDEDSNGWIDENDAVYTQLKIWSKDTEGNDYLDNLKAKDVGAIYLGYAETPFSLKDNENQMMGQIRNSGIFLKEGGGAGVVHQLDLVV